MTTNYKILGQELNSLRIDAPVNGSTVISKIKIKNTSYPTNVDVAVSNSVDIIDSPYFSTQNKDYLIKNKDLSFDDEIEINGGIALESGQSLFIETRNYDSYDVIIQVYGIEESA
jgi:hypothetical protein